MSRTLRSIAPALVLLVAVSAGTAHAMPLPGRVAPSQPTGLFETAWEWLTGLFALDPGQGSAAESRDKAGWEMDPNGAPAPLVSAFNLTPSDEDAPALVANPDGD